MKRLEAIGSPPWSKEDIIGSVDEFLDIYNSRPIKNNNGGMKISHMFGVWFMAKRLTPDLIVESGVWKGQSTWLLEQACPKAQIISFDINLRPRLYISKKVHYCNYDFSEYEWKNLPEKNLVFFDDHQNAYERLKTCKWVGFRDIIFEDNFPQGFGDCYSLKKVLAHAGFDTSVLNDQSKQISQLGNIIQKILIRLKLLPSKPIADYAKKHIKPNSFDSEILKKHLNIYYEFPPLFKTETIFWGDIWDNKYPTPEALFKYLTPSLKNFTAELPYYTWLCYTHLK